MSQGPLLDAVTSLDPARDGAPLDPDAMLARISAEVDATDDDVSHLVPRRASGAARRVAMGAAALTALVVGVVVLQQAGQQDAYATWTATPTLVEPDELAGRCPTSELGPDMSTQIPLDPVLADQRGSYTFVVLAGDGVFSECLVSTATEEPFVIAQGTVPPAGSELDPGAAPILVLDPGDTWGAEGGEGVITTVVGVAMDDVTAVTITAEDGTTARAAVENGWWSVWFPGEVDIDEDVVITTSDGTETTLPFSGLLADWLGAGDG
jgi:hypothetical protein